MSEQTDARAWFSSHTGHRVTAVDMADILGISRNATNARLAKGLDSDDLIAISRGLDVSPIHALVELGKITYAEVFDFLDSDGTLLASASPEQLLYHLAEEILPLSDRISLGAAAKTIADKGEEARAQAATIHHLPAHEGTVTDWDDAQPYAADGSEEEDTTPDDFLP